MVLGNPCERVVQHPPPWGHDPELRTTELRGKPSNIKGDWRPGKPTCSLGTVWIKEKAQDTVDVASV